MIGYLLYAIRTRCVFTADMMATAMCMNRRDYDDLELDRRMATMEERRLVESMCANLCITV